jgi:tetratricopeptide (TPR) repeat protein
VAAALFVLILLAWSNSFSGGFVLDNHFLILDDARVHQATSENVGEILNHPYWMTTFSSGLYRPVTTLSYLFNYAILGNGDRPGGYHCLNLILHALNVFLVYLLTLRLLQKLWPAVFIAAIWAVHPVVTESVTNIIGRSDLLACFALLAGLLMYLKSTESPGWRKVAWLAGLMAVTTLGAFSKESAVAILGVIVLYEFTWWKERKQLRGLLYGCAAVAPPLLLMIYQRSVVFAASSPRALVFTDNPLIGASFLRARLTAIAVMAKYLWLLVCPLKLSCDYSFNQIPVASGAPRDWLAWIAVLAAVIAAAATFKWNRAAFFFAGLAFVGFIPVSNLVFFTGTIMAERFLYVPAIAFAACLVLATFWISGRIHWRPLAPIALCLVIAALGARTWERNLDWHDEATLWISAVKAAPNSFKTHHNLAFTLLSADSTHSNLGRILEEEEKSLAILNSLPDPLNIEGVYSTAGQQYALQGDLLQRRGSNGQMTVTPESTRSYQRSLELLLHGVAIDRALNENYGKAELARGKDPSDIIPVGMAPMYYVLAATCMRLGKFEEAYSAAAYAVRLSPSYADAYVAMGQALLALNRKEDAAISLWEGALITGSQQNYPYLLNLYTTGLDPKGCSFVRTSTGVSLNPSCEIVHSDICKASAALTDVLLQDQQQGPADEIRNQALVKFGCSLDELK